MSAEEILSEKVRAILKRSKGRDLFDVWFLMSKEVNLNWDMAQKKMGFYREKVSFKDLISKGSLIINKATLFFSFSNGKFKTKDVEWQNIIDIE